MDQDKKGINEFLKMLKNTGHNTNNYVLKYDLKNKVYTICIKTNNFYTYNRGIKST